MPSSCGSIRFFSPDTRSLIVEATGFKRDSSGTVELIATPDATRSNFAAQATCAAEIAR